MRQPQVFHLEILLLRVSRYARLRIVPWSDPEVLWTSVWRDANGGVQFIKRVATAFGRCGTLCPPNLSVASPRWRTQIVCRLDWVCSAPQMIVPETAYPRQFLRSRNRTLLDSMAHAGSHDAWCSCWSVICERCEAPRKRLELHI